MLIVYEDGGAVKSLRFIRVCSRRCLLCVDELRHLTKDRLKFPQELCAEQGVAEVIKQR